MSILAEIKGTMLSIMKVLYEYWLRFAHILGLINTVIILFIVYFSVFVPYKLVILFLGKDFLETKLNKSSNSYWKLKILENDKRETYLKQF